MIGKIFCSLVLSFALSLSSVMAFAAQQEYDQTFQQHDPNSTIKLGYAELTGALRKVVYDVGRSERRAAPNPEKMTGSRFSRTSTTRYRLEGNRIIFSFQSSDMEILFGRIREGLEQAADEVGLENLNRNEQLAFWMNLHNAALIEQLAHVYPVQSTRKLKLKNGDPFYTTPVVTVHGVPLSLNDIRHKVVYRNYKNPLVIYGFFRGNVGGPNIRRAAFTSTTIGRDLQRNAYEFVNSLRGVENFDRKIRVSEIYDDASVYFPNWEVDLRDHLSEYGEESVDRIMARSGAIKATVYDWTIADISYGDASPPIGNVITTSVYGGPGFQQASVRMTPQTREFLSRIEQRKFRQFERNGGRVVIEDFASIEELDLAGGGRQSAGTADRPLDETGDNESEDQ